jgi:hypothetical protein
MSIASTLHLASGKRQFSHRLGMASGLLSLAFGLLVAYQICFASRLFTVHPPWMPK